MTESIVVVAVVGARPQFVKVAPFLTAVERARDRGAQIRVTLVHTGQHYDYEMSQSFFDDLAICAPDKHLGVGSGSHAWQTAEMMSRLEPVIESAAPHLVCVFGDTNSTLAGALTAAKLNVSVAHVEAGMRSRRKDMPEEINRVVADHLSDLLFCATSAAAAQLAREGISTGVVVTGDLMLEVLHEHLPATNARVGLLDALDVKPAHYALATVHRAENTDDNDRLARITDALEQLAERIPVVFPVHPRTRAALGGRTPRGVKLVDPVGYLDMVCLERNARVVLTDSGGVQKEACWLGVPCVTLRDETEWPETTEGGWNVLAGIEPTAVVGAALRPVPSSGVSEELNRLGAGDAIVDTMIRFATRKTS